MSPEELLVMYWLCKYGPFRDEARADFWREEYKAAMRKISHYPPVFGNASSPKSLDEPGEGR